MNAKQLMKIDHLKWRAISSAKSEWAIAIGISLANTISRRNQRIAYEK
jgi:hypothetical protein